MKFRYVVIIFIMILILLLNFKGCYSTTSDRVPVEKKL